MRGQVIDVIRRSAANRKMFLGSVFLLVFLIMSLFPSLLAPYGVTFAPSEMLQPPSWKHLFGTDDMGVDVFSLIVYGASNSLVIAIAAAIISGFIGSSIGLISGYYSGILGEILMRLTDVFLVMPMILLAIILAAILEPSLWNVVLIIGITGWTSTARIVRSQVLSIKERPFVERARTVGCGDGRIILRYLLPRVLSLMLTNTILLTAYAIVTEAFLSFLGLGSPATTWGRIMFYAFGRGTAYAYWIIVPPGIAIALAALTFIMLGTGFEEAFNVKARRVLL